MPSNVLFSNSRLFPFVLFASFVVNLIVRRHGEPFGQREVHHEGREEHEAWNSTISPAAARNQIAGTIRYSR